TTPPHYRPRRNRLYLGFAPLPDKYMGSCRSYALYRLDLLLQSGWDRARRQPCPRILQAGFRLPDSRLHRQFHPDESVRESITVVYLFSQSVPTVVARRRQILLQRGGYTFGSREQRQDQCPRIPGNP